MSAVSENYLVGKIVGAGHGNATKWQRFGRLGKKVGKGCDWLSEAALESFDEDEFFLIAIVLPPGKAQHDESEDGSWDDDAGAGVELHGGKWKA